MCSTRLMNVMKKKGIIIFDLDDTLVDKESIFVEAQRNMLKVLAKKDSRIHPDDSFDTLREIDYELIKFHGGKHKRARGLVIT